MNREEAIDRLKGLFGNGYSKQEEALNMAIKALEQEPCDNAVSRQDVLDLAKKGILVSNGNYESVCKAINELPSVNPQPCQEKWIDEDDNRYICKECEYAHKPQKEPCEDAISRQAVLDILKDKWNMFSDANDAIQESIDTIEAISPVTPQPKTGYWIDDNENEIGAQYGIHLYKCSECDEYANAFVGGTEDWWDIEKPNYCPNCGARMVEPQERSDKE